MSDDTEIVFSGTGGVGRILLNRPQALNALTLPMCARLLPQLKAWRNDPAVKAALIAGAGGKAFCAGGDVIGLYKDHVAGGDLAERFWREEYRCNALIKHFGKPYVALLDGIVMGGGVGVSVHGSHCVATEKTMLAMPETAIGLFPDVGGSYFLSRLPDGVGMFLGLTGQRLGPSDVVALGIAQALVPQARLAALEAALAESGGTFDDVDRIIAAHAEAPGTSPLSEHRAAIKQHFNCNSVEEVFRSLETDAGPWAATQRDALKKCSPTALKLTFAQITRGRSLSFDDCMRQEWRMAKRIARGHDFFEGVRARLVDKDHAPRWQHLSLAAVSPTEIETYFAPLPGDELDLSDIAN